MNNNGNVNNDPVLDWILQGNLTEDNNKPMSTDLLNLFLTQNLNVELPATSQPLQQQQQQQPEKVSPEMISSSNMNTSSPSEEDDEPTDAQLKMMPSKERRQLRNKISARNFRNRRKEYITTLEKEMDECKAENSQLKLEVKWVRGMMDKMQAENDRLRLELVLCKEGIQPTRNIAETLAGNVPTATTSTAVSASPEFLLNNTMTTSTCNSNWEVALPRNTSPTSNTNNTTPANNDVYLAHASMPEWDMSSIFAKNNKKNICSKDVDLIRKYPLLAPALMSIVLNHTMTMTTEEIIANSTLYDPTWSSPPESKNNKYAFTSLSDSAAWQQMLLLPPTHQEDSKVNKQDTPQNTTTSTQQEELDTMTWLIRNYCPLNWVQRQFCNFVISYVVVKYPHLDTKCRTYLPICEKYRQKKPIKPLV